MRLTLSGRTSRHRRPTVEIARPLALILALLAACAGAPSPPAIAADGAAAPPKPPGDPVTAVVGVTPQREWADGILYFVVLDRFANGDRGNDVQVDPQAKGAFHGGDLAGLRAQLDELTGLGVTAIWITPVVDNIDGFVTGAGFPDWAYHGYWADDFGRLDPRFGTEEELAGLVADAHARGMKVLLDVVYNHAGYGSRYLTDARTRGWLRSGENGGCGSDDLTSCLAGLPDFRTELPEVADYLMEQHLGLAKRVALDGFRLDTVKHVDHPFWREHRHRIRQEIGEDFFLVGEVWGGDAASLDPWFVGDEMDAGFDFSFQGSTLGWLEGRGRTVAFDRYLAGRERVREGHLLAHFLSSHDVPGALFQLQGDRERFRLAALLQMTVAGLPTIYYGEEVGRPGGDWPENRSNMPWGERPIQPGAGLPRDEGLRADYQKLIAIRRAHPALWRGSHQTVSTEGDLLVFARVDRDETVLVAVNRGALPATVTVPLPVAWAGRTVTDLWREQAPLATGGQLGIAVEPRGARILVAD